MTKRLKLQEEGGATDGGGLVKEGRRKYRRQGSQRDVATPGAKDGTCH